VLATAGLAVVGAGIHLGYLPMIVVGLVGAGMGGYFGHRAARADDPHRLADHLTGVIASGALTYTAIAIVMANRAMPEFFHGRFGILVWTVPTLVALPAIVILRRRHGPAVR
jgi:hypothetical protein